MAAPPPNALRPLDSLHAIRLYHKRRAARSKQWHYSLKGLEIVAAASIPAAALLGIGPVVLGTLGALVVALNAAQQVVQPHLNWVKARSTSERLKKEERLYTALAGPYSDVPDADKLLAERMEEVLDEERTGWESRTEVAGARRLP